MEFVEIYERALASIVRAPDSNPKILANIGERYFANFHFQSFTAWWEPKYACWQSHIKNANRFIGSDEVNASAVC